MTIEAHLKSLVSEDSDAEDKCVFILGHDVNVYSGLPNCAQFNASLVKSIAQHNPDIWCESDIDDLLAKLKCQTQVMHTAWNIFGDSVLESLDQYLGGQPNAVHEYLAIALANGHTVISTSYDNLLERAFEVFTGSQPYLIHSDTDFETSAKEIEKNGFANFESTIIKANGVIETEHSDPDKKYSCIKSRLKKLGNGLPGNYIKTFEHIFKTRDIIVIGYNGYDDQFTLDPLLKYTPSERHVTWLFNNVTTYQKETEDFVLIEERHQKLVQLTRHEFNLFNVHRGLESFFMLDLLLSRPSFKLFEGHLMSLISKVLGKTEASFYVSNHFQFPFSCTTFKGHAFAHALHSLTGNVEKCSHIVETWPDEADHESVRLRSDSKLELAKLCISGGVETEPERLNFAETILEDAKSTYVHLNSRSKQNECTVELIKIQICRRENKKALQSLDKLEEFLERSPHYNGIKKHLIQVFIQKGLLFSMNEDGKANKKSKSLTLLKTALYYSTRLDDQLLQSFCHQTLAAHSLTSDGSFEEIELNLREAIRLSQLGADEQMTIKQYKLMARAILQQISSGSELTEDDQEDMLEKVHSLYKKAENLSAAMMDIDKNSRYEIWLGLIQTCSYDTSENTQLQKLLLEAVDEEGWTSTKLIQLRLLDTLVSRTNSNGTNLLRMMDIMKTALKSKENLDTRTKAVIRDIISRISRSNTLSSDVKDKLLSMKEQL